MVKIRLTRVGRHKLPAYRIVVTDSASKRDGRYIEVVGYYHPLPKISQVRINMERVQYWIHQGAQMSDTVRQLVGKQPPASLECLGV